MEQWGQLRDTNASLENGYCSKLFEARSWREREGTACLRKCDRPVYWSTKLNWSLVVVAFNKRIPVHIHGCMKVDKLRNTEQQKSRHDAILELSGFQVFNPTFFIAKAQIRAFDTLLKELDVAI
jgi:hypothetical protein